MHSSVNAAFRTEVIGMHGVTKQLPPEQVWIARLFRAACADERVLGRLGISVDPAVHRRPSHDGAAGGLNPSVLEKCKARSDSAVEKPEDCGVPV